jgi:arylsulfatase A-like enzyme
MYRRFRNLRRDADAAGRQARATTNDPRPFESSKLGSCKLAPVKAIYIFFLVALPLTAAQPQGYTIPTIDISGETHRQVIVDREPGQYLGHPSTLLLSDNRTILVTYPRGHGKGGIVYKKSYDGGLSWTDRLATPKNWSTSLEVPTLFRLHDRKGKPRVLMFSGKAAGIRVAYSDDDGENWSPLGPISTPGPIYGGIVAMGSMVELKDGSYMAFFHDDGRWLRDPPSHPEGKHFEVYKVVSSDGGLSWSQPEVVAKHPVAHLCEPGAIRSPDGQQIAVLLRENSRQLNSFVIFSNDEGETWTEPRELPAALTGDRHTARYAPDGRLFITFRDRTHISPTQGDWVGWVGTYDDIVRGNEGEYRVRLLDNLVRSDTAYPGLELLPDGTFVTTTYGHWVPEEEPFIVSVRFKLEELDQRAKVPGTLTPGIESARALAAKETMPAATRPTAPRADAATQSGKPNVLFVAIDDLNDWALADNSPLHMPNLERLARRGTVFTHAYTESPACNPSRSALLLGRRSSTTGIYNNNSDWKAAVPDAVTLPKHFLNNGYRVEGAGKIFHHHQNSSYHDESAFHRFQKMQLDPMPPARLNGLDGPTPVAGVGSPNFDWGQWPLDERSTPDSRTAQFGVEFLSREHENPFFLAIGLFRPHMPFHAPPKYFSFYPDYAVTMPLVNSTDRSDLPSGAFGLLDQKAHFFETILAGNAHRETFWQEAVRAYQASTTYADHQLGRVLDALAASPYADNTIIVVWSDHGYHLGEKEHWEKFALWERSTRVPLVFVAPGVTTPGARSNTPVSLLDLYPTLVEMCGLPKRGDLEGESLLPQLRDARRERETPAIMTYQRGNHAVRTKRWRYIHYADGTEELYDHDLDPHEWENVAGRKPGVIAELARWLP